MLLYCGITGVICLSGCEPKNSGLYSVNMLEQENSGIVSEETYGSDISLDMNADDTETAAYTETTPQTDVTAIDADSPRIMYVHVCGAVNNPGVYELNEGDRVFEAVDKAGGFTQEADCSYVNLAIMISDGMKLWIPTVEEAANLSRGVNEAVSMDSQQSLDTSNSGNGRININTADINALCTIPGIGETKAKAIIKYREGVGEFKKIEDIQKVSGIGEGTFNRIRDEIVTGYE